MKINRVKAVSLLALVLLAAAIAAWYMKIERPRIAHQTVSAALVLTHPSAPLETAKELVPRAYLTDRKFAVIYLLLKADEMDGSRYSGAQFWLGVYLLDKNCETARYYLESYLKVVPTHQRTQEILKIVDESGCDQAASDFRAWLASDKNKEVPAGEGMNGGRDPGGPGVVSPHP